MQRLTQIAIAEGSFQRRLSNQLHQYCFFPRALLTPSDAIFVAQFIRCAHDMGTAAFSTLFAYDNFFGESLAGAIFSATTNEARNLGRCLSAIMSDLDSWHHDEARFKKEALGISGDASEDAKTTPLPGMMFRLRRGHELKAMTWQQFRNFYAKCHNTLTRVCAAISHLKIG
jgi:THO complex subunit 2